MLDSASRSSEDARATTLSPAQWQTLVRASVPLTAESVARRGGSRTVVATPHAIALTRLGLLERHCGKLRISARGRALVSLVSP